MLAGFPEGNAGAKSLRKARGQALKVIDQIEAVLAGGVPSPKSPRKPKSPGREPGKKPVPPKSSPKLDYKQKELLKNVRWYLRETEKYLRPAQGVLAQVDGKGPRPVIALVKQALASAQKAASKHKLAWDYVGKLPASHPEVARMREQVGAIGQALAAVRSRLGAEAGRLAKMTGMGSYPRYRKDFGLLGALSQRYGNFELLRQQAEKMAQVIREDAKAIQEIQRIAKTYQPLAEQKTSEGKAIEKRILYVLGKRRGFIQKLKAYKQALPGEIDGFLKEVLRIAKEGVEKKRPLYFGENSGIAQQLGFAENKLKILRAFGEKEAGPVANRIAAVRNKVKQAAKTLEADIIANNQMPPDRYREKDRDALVKRAIETWGKRQKGAKILMVRIPSKAWTRKTRWQWSAGAFHKVDYSKLQVQLLLQHNDKLAVIRPVNLFKDHMKGDSLRAFPFDGKDEELQPQRFLLLKRVK
jgi:hypothetical protein